MWCLSTLIKTTLAVSLRIFVSFTDCSHTQWENTWTSIPETSFDVLLTTWQDKQNNQNDVITMESTHNAPYIDLGLRVCCLVSSCNRSERKWNCFQVWLNNFLHYFKSRLLSIFYDSKRVDIYHTTNWQKRRSIAYKL